jgi:hypothetical protein
MPLEPSFQICSPAFSVDDIGMYSLQIELHAEALRFVVFNEKDLIVLEEHTFDKQNEVTDLIKKYKEIIDEHAFLKANYWNSIAVFTDSRIIYPISKEIFDLEHIPIYEKLFFQQDLSSSYVQYESKETVFLMAYDEQLDGFVESVYSNKAVKIQSSTFKMADYFNHNSNSDSTIINFSQYHFTCIHPQNNIQTFPIENFSEAKLMGSFKAEGCTLYGQITTFHPLFNKLKSTFKTINFGSPPPDLKTPSFMAELPSYKYMSLLV